MSDENFEWFRWYYKDWMLGTVGFSDSSKGVYIDLLGLLWDNGPMTKNDIRKAFPRRAPGVLDPVIAKLVEVRPNLWSNVRLDREREKSIKLSEKNSKNGKLGGIAKAKKLANASQPLPQTPKRMPSVSLPSEGKGKDKDKEKDPKKDVKRKMPPFHSGTKPEDMSDECWQTFLKMRKDRRAPVTDDVVKRLKAEAGKNGISAQEAAEYAMYKGWVSYTAEYDKTVRTDVKKPIKLAY